MSNWNNNWHKFTYVGRFGDNLMLADLPNNLRSVAVTDYFDDSVNDDERTMLVCGSPGEVRSMKDEEILLDAHTDFRSLGSSIDNNRKYIWIMVALSANDQLRQRVAWALSQVSQFLHIKNVIPWPRGTNVNLFFSTKDFGRCEKCDSR
jgi:hypothetical protein